eukprot:4025130-Alexandrium_andersonii.AAC.1
MCIRDRVAGVLGVFPFPASARPRSSCVLRWPLRDVPSAEVKASCVEVVSALRSLALERRGLRRSRGQTPAAPRQQQRTSSRR